MEPLLLPISDMPQRDAKLISGKTGMNAAVSARKLVYANVKRDGGACLGDAPLPTGLSAK